jgi:hypothetical protein
MASLGRPERPTSGSGGTERATILHLAAVATSWGVLGNCWLRETESDSARGRHRRGCAEKTGKKRPWKSLRYFHFSHSFKNNQLDDRDHFSENPKASVASLRGLIRSPRNIDRHPSGMLIGFTGIPSTAYVTNRANAEPSLLTL